MFDLASTVSQLPEVRGRAAWAGHEYVKGWGVFGLPFDSGHVLALRVFPENDFAPYRTVWHRDPQGKWAIYVDGPRLDTACPRYYGDACEHTGYAGVGLAWTGPATLRVTMEQPALEWTLTASSTWLLGALNAASAALPLATWRTRPLLWARELMAQALGMGHLQLCGVMPSGHTGTLMPQRMFFVDDSRARFDGLDLGRPVHLRENPTIGGVALPARGILAMGEAMWRVRDAAEFERARQATAAGV
jgi:hypothetical protein